ncbi:MAG: hypothetical protein V2A73_11095 [Pseudomonadota bacterium]
MDVIAANNEKTMVVRAILLVDQLVRSPRQLLERIRAEDRLAELARIMVLTILIAGGAFGAAVGAWRGGSQVLFAAVKMPLVILLTTCICAPVLTALTAAVGSPARMVRDLALVLAALALGSVVLAAQAPLLLFARAARAPYHSTAILVFVCCLVAAIPALMLLARGIGHLGQGAVLVFVGLVAMVLPVGAQMSWTLRPYLVRPRTLSVPFVRSVEGNLWDAVRQSTDSARGIYHDRDDLAASEKVVE